MLFFLQPTPLAGFFNGNMKITRITTIPIKLQMKEAFIIANVTNFNMHYVLMRIETDEGIIGYGEAAPAWEVTGETYQSVLGCVALLCNKSLLGESLIGREISSLHEVEEILSLLYPKNTPYIIYANASA